MITAAAVTDYLTDHLLGELYFDASEARRRAALRQANADIAAELNDVGPDDSEPFAVAAVCEQLLYLLAGIGPDAETASIGALGTDADLVSESIDGAGSRAFRSGVDRTIAPRARRYLAWFRPAGAVQLRRG